MSKYDEAWNILISAIETLEHEVSCDHYEHITLEKINNNMPIAKSKNTIIKALTIAAEIERGDKVVVPKEPTFEQLDAALHEVGTPFPKESKQWCREFYKAMIEASEAENE